MVCYARRNCGSFRINYHIFHYWILHPLLYLKDNESDSDFQSLLIPQFSLIGRITSGHKWIIYLFDPVAWVAMIFLIALYIQHFQFLLIMPFLHLTQLMLLC